ncbi:response regulator [Variovorax terrae]|uniref:Response regulator transcription factor n=1 Tax=Variovorax terrae TaxID=2923278 RepID=A0A9X1VXT5_9BURK|nr:response regulator transcription factor [Variovorax terrae]MCJ0765402.1 response regulator transcription factor [Variovorax terrae]
MMTRIRTTVVLVEDNPLHARRYRENLSQDPSLQLLAEYATAAEAMRHAGALAPDVALIDLDLPDASGFAVIRQIRQQSPHTAIMVVSVFGGERNLVEAIEAGATGYLLKDSLPSDFNASLHALRAGESPISPSLARYLLTRLQRTPGPAPLPAAEAGPSPLSRRETAILEAIARGRSIAEIGDALHISPLTVKSHVQNIYRKLEARSRQHAVFLAQQRGLLKL